MALRQILGPFKHPIGGAALNSATIKVRLVRTFATSAETFPALGATVTTDGSGNPTPALFLATPGLYAWLLPDGTALQTAVLDGSAVPFHTLFSAAQVTITPNALEAALASLTFTGLSDTPNSYAGQASKVVAVKSDESGVEFVAGGAGGGVTDHGALTGLSDDDHPQYLNQARGDGRYYTEVEVDAALAGKAPVATTLAGYGITDAASDAELDSEAATRAAADTALDTRVDALEVAPPAHTHPQSDVTNLVTDLAAKAPLASPTFTGTPAAPTAAGGTNTTQIATTAFVTSAVSTHEADTTAVHGIADTSTLLTTASAAGGDLSGTLGNLQIAADAVGDAELRNSAALSVIGRAANSTGDPADIAAGSDGQVLRRSGTALGFGTVATAGIADDAITYAKIQNVSATSRILGRVTSGAGDVEELTGAQALGITGAQQAVAQGRPKSGSTYYTLSMLGVEPTALLTTTVFGNGFRYEPFVTLTAITIDQIVIEVTTAAAAANTARVGIYNADVDLQPTSLVVDAGTVATDSTGVKAASISTTLQPGRYLLAINASADFTARFVRGGNVLAGFLPALGASPILNNMTNSTAYAAFPSTGAAWTFAGNGNSGMQRCMWVRISSP